MSSLRFKAGRCCGNLRHGRRAGRQWILTGRTRRNHPVAAGTPRASLGWDPVRNNFLQTKVAMGYFGFFEQCAANFLIVKGKATRLSGAAAIREEARGRSYGSGVSSPARRNDGRDSKVCGANVASRPAQQYAKTGRVQTTLSDRGRRRDD